tara:strand:- start:353 stop:874 length:522 start_codon:yes stop_codon:yes gene_type:complete
MKPNLDQILKIDFATGWDFSVQFLRLTPKEKELLQGPNFSWDKWVPAKNVQHPRGGIATQTMNYPYPVEIPVGGSPETISLTLYDSSARHMRNFLEWWFNHEVVRHETQTVGCLLDIVRELKIKEYYPKEGGPGVIESSYLVFPKGELPVTNDGETSAHIEYSIQLAVAGRTQ